MFKKFKNMQHNQAKLLFTKFHLKINTMHIDLKFSCSLSFNLNCIKSKKIGRKSSVFHFFVSTAHTLIVSLSFSAVGTLSWLIWKQIEFQFSSLYIFLLPLSHTLTTQERMWKINHEIKAENEIQFLIKWENNKTTSQSNHNSYDDDDGNVCIYCALYMLIRKLRSHTASRIR